MFGEGPADAEIVLIGEQPGDREDREGHPFVGPAGRLLDHALEAAGIDRATVYVTNAVKHFKFEPRGKRRIHKKPNAEEIRACTPWLDAELETLAPKVVVCLGATAAQAVIGRTFQGHPTPRRVRRHPPRSVGHRHGPPVLDPPIPRRHDQRRGDGGPDPRPPLCRGSHMRGVT